ncbi:MAG: hypothetical protein GY854_22190 [Deltaproteobacteria bacterium]|nr:hypothetical protein [Deltaproteobacteria bacterium]
MDNEMLEEEFFEQADENTEQDTPSVLEESEKGETEKPETEAESSGWRDEQEDWSSEAEETPIDESSGEKIKVAVDWVELEGALENNSPELHSFLNTVTGDVIRIFEGGEGAESRLKQSESSPDYVYIEPVSSREQYRWMEEFIEIVEEPTLKDKLNIAIDGKGAFRRFKDVLVGYPVERERWFQKRASKLRTHMTDWLTSKNVIPTNTPPREGEVERQEENSRPRGDLESRTWREGGADLRNAAHEMIDLVPSRELPTAVAFLEFLRGRRGFRRSRYS